eukprot:COSAG01_NODE_7273_length_3273_cov_2.418583_1_plen_789_part_10
MTQPTHLIQLTEVTQLDSTPSEMSAAGVAKHYDNPLDSDANIDANTGHEAVDSSSRRSSDGDVNHHTKAIKAHAQNVAESKFNKATGAASTSGSSGLRSVVLGKAGSGAPTGGAQVLKRMFKGTGEALEQLYLFTSAIQKLTLFTIPDIGFSIAWPEAWLKWINVLQGLSFGFGVIFSRLPSWIIFAGSLMVPVYIFGRGLYLILFMSSKHRKEIWLYEHGQDGWKTTRRKLLAKWFALPTLLLGTTLGILHIRLSLLWLILLDGCVLMVFVLILYGMFQRMEPRQETALFVRWHDVGEGNNAENDDAKIAHVHDDSAAQTVWNSNVRRLKAEGKDISSFDTFTFLSDTRVHHVFRTLIYCICLLIIIHTDTGDGIYIYALDDEDGSWLSGSASYTFANHSTSSDEMIFSDASLVVFCIAVVVWSRALFELWYRRYLRKLLVGVHNKGGHNHEFFRAWMQSEAGVLIFLYAMAYIGAFVACLREIQIVNEEHGEVVVISLLSSLVLIFAIIGLAGLFAARIFSSIFKVVGEVGETRGDPWDPMEDPRVRGSVVGCGICTFVTFFFACIYAGYTVDHGLGVLACVLGPMYGMFPVLVMLLLALYARVQCEIQAHLHSENGRKQRTTTDASAMLPRLGALMYLGDNRDKMPIGFWPSKEITEDWIKREPGPRSKWETLVDAAKSQAERSSDLSSRLLSFSFSLIQAFEPRYWFFKPLLMVEKALVAMLVFDLEGNTQVVCCVLVAALFFCLSYVARPYVGEAEDLADISTRFATVLIVCIGAVGGDSPVAE